MKGSYDFRVKSKKLLFEFSIKRNITLIKGDSATGKTTLLHMMYEYLRVGRESGYSITTDADYSEGSDPASMNRISQPILPPKTGCV